MAWLASADVYKRQPIAFVLSRYTALPLPIVYLFVNGVDLLKCIIGFILVKKGVWVNNIDVYKRQAFRAVHNPWLPAAAGS